MLGLVLDAEVLRGPSRAVGAWVLGALLLGCESKETKACLSEYASAQQLVLKVEARSSDSVGKSLAAVESALTLCRAASRHGEVDQLIKAKNELGAQLSALERRARRQSAKEPTGDELAKLESEGDPSCPRGQAYVLSGSKQIRCTGPQLVEMNLAQVKAHFEEQDYRIRTPAAGTLEVERGAERYTFLFDGTGNAPPRCVVLVPAPGLPWQEAISRATGSNPGRLKNPGTLRTSRGSLPFAVDEQKVIIRLGQCPDG